MLTPKYKLPQAFIISLVSMLIMGSCSEILSPDIQLHTIAINSPSDSLYTSNNKVFFWWENDPDIEQYEFRITYFDNGNLILLLDSVTLDNKIEVDFAQEGIFDWQVRGVNEGSETNWIKQSLLIDRTAPDRATALAFDGDTLYAGLNDSLSWYSSDFQLNGITFPVQDSLLLYRKNDSITIASRVFFSEGSHRKFGISANSPSPLNGPGVYYWRIVSIDRANNRQTSNQFHFVVQ